MQKNAITTKHGAVPGKTQTHDIVQYNLDVIISVGYRVKSKREVLFRKWANSVLKDYILKGYVINEKRLESLNKTIEIQSRMLASALEVEAEDVYKVVSEYTKALDLLDDYDHQNLNRPNGNKTILLTTTLFTDEFLLSVKLDKEYQCPNCNAWN